MRYRSQVCLVPAEPYQFIDRELRAAFAILDFHKLLLDNPLLNSQFLQCHQSGIPSVAHLEIIIPWGLIDQHLCIRALFFLAILIEAELVFRRHLIRYREEIAQIACIRIVGKAVDG